MRLATAYTDSRQGVTALFGEREGKFHDLTAWLPGVSDVGSLLRHGSLNGARRALDSAGSEPGADISQLDLAPPLTLPGSIVCVGRNYPEHNKEGKVPTPEYPLLFSKFPNTLLGSGKAIPMPTISRELDYEGELALVIGQTASRIDAESAMSYVAGYTIINDISARDLQDADSQWIRGKSLDGFCPIGPTFVTADEVEDPYELVIHTLVNGETRQHEKSAEMFYKIPQLLAFITEGITLNPGDVVATGTPSGTGIGFDPPKYLTVGDRLSVTIEPIGTLESTVEEVV